ncbi:MAG: Gfo/Idh/MocA family oxidoreductase [Thermoleophilia bacterium]|nr:Gfo/Idh/MocA family oxidoreductase [Thermoleophilia bacterium]
MPPGSTAAPLRVGIAGFGLAGEVFHAPLIDATAGLEVSSVVTSNAERAERVKSRYPDASIAESVDDLWGNIDLLVVAAPNRFHAELGLASIEHDTPVVIDKPFASTVAEAERVIAAGGRVTVFQNRRWDGDFLTIRKLLNEGRLGQITRFESRFERFRPELEEGWRESSDPAAGGGQLADLGAHLIDQAIVLFGPPVHVYAEVDRRRPGAQADDDVFVALEHAGGERSHLFMGKVAPLSGSRFRLTGLGGGASIEGLDPQEAQLGSGMRPDSPGYGLGGPGHLVLGADAVVESLDLERGAYEEFYAQVVGWVLHGVPPPVDPRESLLVMRVLEAARISSEENRVVSFLA